MALRFVCKGQQIVVEGVEPDIFLATARMLMHLIEPETYILIVNAIDPNKVASALKLVKLCILGA